MSIVEMRVPVIGESINEVTLSQWLVQNGDFVEIDQPICEFESDKATLEFPAEVSGKIIHVAAEGDDLEINALVAKIDTSAAASTQQADPAPQETSSNDNTMKTTGETIEMKVPVIGESITEVTLSQWLVEDGSIVSLDTPICEFESDKATLEFPAEATGRIKHVAAEGNDLEIGALVATIEVMDGEVSTQASTETPSAANMTDSSPSTESHNYATGHASPVAAKMMRENNIDPNQVKGTGKNNRITKADVMLAIENPQPTKSVQAPSQPAPQSSAVTTSQTPKVVGERSERREKMSRMRRTIAKRLVSAKNNTAMLTTFNEVDLSEVMKLRKRVNEDFLKKHGVKLGFMSLFAKACANALMDMPDVNASLDGDHLVYHDYVDISIAVSTPNGLVVPPIKNVHTMTCAAFEKELKRIAGKARDGQLTLDEMTGGTFTITNGGIFGSMMSTPILNEPQSAILGMHNIINRPVAVDGQVVIRPMMYLALSYDHRVIDGSTSVTFLVKVKEQLEDPIKLFLDY